MLCAIMEGVWGYCLEKGAEDGIIGCSLPEVILML